MHRFNQVITNNKGQTLVTLLVFTVVAIAVTTTAVAVMLNTSQAALIIEEQVDVSNIAESGIENAILRLIRDPDYTGELLPVGTGSVTITVSGVSTKTITATAEVGDFRAIQEATVEYIDNRLTVTSWETVY